ncbi:MAG: amino acid adenylation domain-containing protein, partial [Phormidium sp.]
MTNNAFEFISQLRELGINLETDGKTLRCQAPEGALTPNLRQEIARRKTEIISLLKEAKQVKSAEISSIKRVSRDGELPLSFAQQRLWFLDQLSPNSQSYNLLEALQLEGSLDLAALEKSLNQLIDRHEILRTTFPAINGKPIQLINPVVTLTLPIHNLQQLSEEEQTAQICQLAKSFAAETFDLASERLIQFILIQQSATKHILLLKMHHIIYDGWSLNIFFRELSQLYEAFIQKMQDPLTELPIQYADFAVWQRQWLTGEVLERQLNYWQEQLAGVHTTLELPADRPRPPIQSSKGKVESIHLDRDLTQRLKQLSQESETTLFMTLLAAFLVLMSRYSGQLDLLVGTPIANRNIPAIEPLIGFFANTLPLRGDLSGDPTFRDFLAQVRQTTLSAYTHQDLPFEMLVEKLHPERDLSRNPLVQVMFSLQNAPQAESRLSGLKIQSITLPIDFHVKFDLDVNFWENSDSLEGALSYNVDLFDAATISRLGQHLQNLLKAIVTNPQTKISQLPLLSQAERHQLLVEWNNTQTCDRQNKCIHQLFEEQVELVPDALAVIFEDQSLTYRELNNRANQLAHYLQQNYQIKPDSLIGICVKRSLEMVVGILAILKSGGAYLPIDPEYPAERLSFMLEDSQVPVLLTQQQLVESIPEHQANIICLDTDWSEISHWNQENPISEVQLENLAYVIYTSGSTGQPKGAMNTHKGICNRLIWMQEAYQLTTADVVLQKTPFSFDVSVWEFFWTLCNGSRLVIARPEGHRDREYLVNLIAQQQVTTLHFVPSMLQVFLESENLALCQSLRRVICSGEALSLDLQGKCFERLGCELHNLYGPTEAAIDVTYWQCQKDSQLTTVPLGRPIANTQIYILDQNLQPVPIGVPGELHIGGVGLAKGYLNRPELTAEKFIPHPFSNQPNSRLYKTGDLARYLPDGNIEYLGRIDHQVKIRGFRIELGEIEAVLSQHPQVQTSIVIARVDNPGEKRLIAYLVSDSEVTPTIPELRQYLKSKLPEYMVPSAFVFLETLPLTANGKVDRRALPKPESRSGIENSLVIPRTPVEETLFTIWKQVLRVEQIGIHDNFFELGGDSILSIQIISRAKLAGIELTVKQLFTNQTIAELATVAGTSKTAQIPQELVTGKVELTPIQKWFFEQELPEIQHFNQSFLLTVPPEFQWKQLKPIWKKLIEHHDGLRLRYSKRETGWAQKHTAETEIEISHFDLSELTETAVATVIETQANKLQASLNLAEKLIQVGYFKLGAEKPGRLLIIIHHLVVDGVSWRILLEDLQIAYQQISQGKEIELAPKSSSFQEWAKQLRKYAQTETIKSEIEYWRKKSAAKVASLPIDNPTGENTVASASSISVWLNEAETLALLQEVPAAYKTQINDLLLSALSIVISKWTKSQRVLLNLEGHGREEIIAGVDLSRTVGWFTTIFPVLIELEATANLGNIIKSVKEQLRAIPHKGISYGILRYLCDDPSIVNQLHKGKEPEISFNYLGQFSQVLNQTALLQSANESSGNNQSIQGQRSSLLDINAIIAESRLQISWTYSTNLHRGETIEKIAQEFVETLRELIAHCLVPENGGYTPSDFPLIKLTPAELDGVLAKVADKAESGTATNRHNIEDIYPLSPMQQGMLFESLYAPDSGVYCEQITCTLTGNLNVEVFEQAWQQVVAHHATFRTAFVWESVAQPIQIVWRQVEVKLNIHDWRELSTPEQRQRLEEFLHSQREQGFSFSQVPLMSLDLIQKDENTYQFVWSFHHILLDGWSLPVVFQELLNSYQAIAQGEKFEYQISPSYRHYIAWLEQQDREQAKDFWREKLRGFTVPTPLMVDKPLSQLEKGARKYGEQEISFSVATTAAAVSFVREHQLTLNNLVQATWALLLSRYSGETDVVFGATVS